MSGGEPGMEDVFLVLVSGKPGCEAAYRRWFAGCHMADMRALPGVRSAHPFDLAQSSQTTPAELCALYEFADGPAALATIASRKGGPSLPQSEDQGKMIWRLFETLARWPGGPLPTGVDLVVALFKAGRETPQVPRIGEVAAILLAGGASYVRALRLSPTQPARGSDYRAALVIACALPPAKASALVTDALGQGFPGQSCDLVFARASRLADDFTEGNRI